MKKVILLFLVSSLLITSGCGNKQGRYDSFAKCLTEKGVTMYGTEWCSHCKSQKKLFGSSFQHIDYVDCDVFREECLKADVGGYPTWQLNGKNYPGERSLYELSQLSGCELREDIE